MRHKTLHWVCEGKGALYKAALFGFFWLALTLVWQIGRADATINRQINFQGKIVLNSNSTNITNATYNMEFKIYSGGDGVPGGGDETLLWTESRLRNNSQGVVITDGIFQVNLGAVTTLPGSVDFNNSTLWLSMNLGNTNATCTPFSSCSGDGEMNPMVRFTAAPYAFNADLLDGLDSTAFAQLSGSNTWAGTNTFNSQATFNTDVDYVFSGTENISVTSDLAGTVDVVSIIATPSSTGGTTQGILVQQASSANTNGLDNAVTINNADTDLAITAALKIQNSGGGGYTTIIDNQGTLISGAELNLLDGRDTALVDTTDAVNTAITGTGALGAGSIGTGFGAIDVGNDAITTTGTIGTAGTTTFTGAGATFTGTLSATGATLGLGDADTDSLTVTAAIQGANPLRFDGATDDGNEVILAITNPTGGDVTITLPNSTGTVVLDTVLTTEGDIYYRNGSGLTRLARGANGECLTSNTTTILWGSCGGGGGDSVQVNGSAATDANFLDTTASGTVTGTTFTLSTGPNPDTITLTVSNASAAVAGSVTTGTQTFAGDKTFNGSLVLGDATSDTINFTGRVNSSILPSTNDTYDLGSDTLRWKDLYLGGETLRIGTSAADETVISYTTATDSLTIKNATASTTAFQIQNSSSANLFNIDTSTNRIDLFANNAATTTTWATTTALSAARVSVGAVYGQNGYMYVLGGQNSGAQTTVYYAKTNVDGTLGSWATTTALPNARMYITPVVSNGYIYVIGGNDGSTTVQSTYYARINADGTLSAWQTGTNLTTVRSHYSAATYNGYIYIMGGTNGSTDQSTVYYARPQANGNISAWSTTTVLSPAKSAAGGIAVNGYMYTVGGWEGTLTDRVSKAKINGDGTLGSWSDTTGLVGTVENAAVYAANGHLYIAGGDGCAGGGGPCNEVYSAQLNADGTVGSWTAMSNLNTLVGEHGYAQANGYFYTFGGSSSNDGGGTIRTTVQYASVPRVRLGSGLDLVGISGENLAEGASGGTLTAGDTTVVGTLNVMGAATFNQTLAVDGELSVDGQIGASNSGIEFSESDTNPTCASGNYNIYADSSEAKLKQCVNGTVYDLGSSTKYETFTATGTYTKPSDASMIIVDLWGGGGGGGGGAGGNNTAARTGGGGGGGGSYSTGHFMAANVGSTVPVTVGAGGNAGTAGANAVGGNGGVGGDSCFSTTTACAGTMYIRGYGGGGGAGAGAAGNGGGGGAGFQAVGGNSTSTTGATGGGPGGSAANTANTGFGGAGGATAAAGTVNGAQATWAGAGGGASTTAGANNSGSGGSSTKSGGGGGAGGSCAITTCTARNGGAGGYAPATAAGGGGTAGTGGGAGGTGPAGTSAGGGGGGGGANNSAAAGGAGGAGGTSGGGGGGGGGAHTGSTNGGAGGAGGRGEVRIWSIRGSGADLAEAYGTREDLGPGDVVCIDPTMLSGVKRCPNPYDKSALGVITTSPGMVMGEVEDSGAKLALVVMAGRTPIRVNNENGDIEVGDFLTPSSTPGVAMKATKAGQVVGQALGPYHGEDEGMTMVFTKTNFVLGTSTGNFVTDNSSIKSQQQQMLAYLNEVPTALDTPDLSEIFTDKVVAGMEIVTPKVFTNELATDTIRSSSGSDIGIQLDENGEFYLADASGKKVLAFDNQGNATLTGILTADKIKARQVEGLEILTDKISQLDAQMAAITDEEITPNQLEQASMPEDTSAVKVTELGNIRIKNAVVDFDLGVNGSLSVGKGLEVFGAAEFRGSGFFYGLATFVNKAIFKNDVNFEGRATFNADSGGFATIYKNQKEVKIKFDQAYPTTPVVVATIKNGRFANYAYKDLSKDGFVIVLKDPATDNIEFSWTAMSIKDARTSEIIPEPIEPAAVGP